MPVAKLCRFVFGETVMNAQRNLEQAILIELQIGWCVVSWITTMMTSISTCPPSMSLTSSRSD